jgi:NitT/TauT family transport system permease protein
MSDVQPEFAKRRRRFRISRFIPGAISIIAGLAAWQIAVTYLHIPNYVLPKPAAVLAALVDGLGDDPTSRTSFWYHLYDTMKATIAGFLIGCVLGVIIAAIMAEFRLAERALLPYVVGFQSLPKVAIAPLFVIWFGYQIESKVAMSATLTLFPVLINALQGFVSVDRDRVELLASVDASRWQIFRLIKVPSALPLLFAGFNLGIIYALLGTLVAEFMGAQRGVGVIMTQLQSVSDTAGVFALLVMLAVLGYILIGTTRFLQRRIVFWVGNDDRLGE